MKTLCEKKVRNLSQDLTPLKNNELLNIKGGEEGAPTQKDSDFD